MSYKITPEVMYEDFKVYFPGMGDKVVDWYPNGQLEIVIKLQDGSRYTYDYLDKKIFCLSRARDEELEGQSLNEEEFYKEFIRRLRRRMFYRGFDQQTLALALGVSQVTISNYMRGKTRPSSYMLCKMAEVLECSVTELGDTRLK